MITIGLQSVNFSVNVVDPENEQSPIVLQFQDPQSGITVQTVFDPGGWVNFKRHVELDGNVPAIDIARGVPQNGPRMDIPKGR